MRLFNLILFSLIVLATQATVIYPGQTTDVCYEPTTGEYGPTWTTNNPTISISSVGFLCHLTAQAYFGGTATVTCTYKDRIGSTVYTRTRNWTFTCADTKISISPSSKSLKINESFQISCNYNSTTYITPSVQFSGYDNSIVSVSNSGYVTAKSTGSTKIYVKSNLGTNTAICSVTVHPDGNSTSSTSYYDDWDSQGTKVISLNEPGTLSDVITDSEKYSITNLTIRGPLNGSDLRLIRDMCGRDENGTVTNGKLVVLDLKDAIFVSGGAWYFKWGENEYYYTSDSPEIPFKAFHMMKNIKRIRLPKYCTKIANQSLLFCESLEALSMPPGVEELDSNWLYGGYNDMVLSSISLPSSLKKIDYIYNCGNLTEIYCYAVEPPAIRLPDSFASQSNITNGTLYVPKGCAQSYWQANGWRNFKSIKETLDINWTLSIFVNSEHGQVLYNNNEVKQSYGVWYSGYQAFEISSDENVLVEIIPDDGYSISKITLNGLTQNIPLNGILQIGKLSSHTKLEITFEESSSLRENLLNNEQVFDVFNLQGINIIRHIKYSEITNLPPGVYIIKNDKNSWKIIHN